MVIDQTCKRLIDEKKTTVKGIYDGIVYYFCSEKCKEEFILAPFVCWDDPLLQIRYFTVRKRTGFL